MTEWFDIAPADAVGLDLTKRLDITAPLNEEGERCPWPWGPQQLVGVPLGQFHCEYCGAMCMAGIRHPDYTGWEEEFKEYMRAGEERVRRLWMHASLYRNGPLVHPDEPPLEPW